MLLGVECCLIRKGLKSVILDGVSGTKALSQVKVSVTVDSLLVEYR